MNCRECQDLIHRLLDGEAVDPADACRSHVESCARCRGDLAAARVLLSGLRELPSIETSTMLAPRLTALVQEDREHRLRRGRYRWYATVTLAASILVFAGIGNLISWFRGPDKNQPTIAEEHRPVPSPRSHEAM